MKGHDWALGTLSSARAAAEHTEVTMKVFTGGGQRLKCDQIPSRARLDELPSRGHWADRYEGKIISEFSLSGHPNSSLILSLCVISAGGIQTV